MELSELLLTKEEVQMWYSHFSMPIHPRLVSNDVNIDREIARKVFAQAADEWYDELIKYVEIVEVPDEEKWIREVYLKGRPKIVMNEFGHQILSTVSCWQDDILFTKTGFAYSLMINRNAGGSLYFRKDDYPSCETFAAVDAEGGSIRLGREKLLAFSIGGKLEKLSSGPEGAAVYRYGSHNMDHYPGALFLRNWSMLYLNEAMKQVFGEKN